MFLYPNTITSLKHNWTHPAIPDVQEDKIEELRAESEKWMRAWAMEHVSDDYYGSGAKVSEDDAYAFAIEAGEENYIGPYESARDHIDNEWWNHWERITGKVGKRDEGFSCSC